MKIINNSVAGFDVPVSVAETNDELDKLAGRTNAAAELGTQTVLYRGYNTAFRRIFAERLEEASGVERETEEVPGKTRKVKVEEVKDATGKIITPASETTEPVLRFKLTEGAYFKHVWALLASKNNITSDEAKATFNPLALEVAAGLKVDYTESESTPAGPKKLAKVYTDAAAQIIASGGADKAAAKLTGLLNRTVAATPESLALAVKDYQKQKEAALASELTS